MEIIIITKRLERMENDLSKYIKGVEDVVSFTKSSKSLLLSASERLSKLEQTISVETLSSCSSPRLASSSSSSPFSSPQVDLPSSPVSFAEENGNILFLVTKHGGHVGWPLKYSPRENKWLFQSQCALIFFHSLLQMKQDKDE